MHNLHSTCQAGFYDEESIECTFRALGPQLQLLERSPSFDLGFDLEIVGQCQNGLDFWVRGVKMYPDTNLLPNR